MINKKEKETPKVFVSYSHDSKHHRRWVGEFASMLVHKGVDVIFDQWDLGPGDDIPKFMERGVANADRVLMICSEPYVEKADEGKGGVGYEAMIVTGELVQNLGTSKFIPIIRQSDDNCLLPKSVSTRFYINLSSGDGLDEQFELLLRELHQEPVSKKPPLGKNPFAQQPSGVEIPAQLEIESSIPDLDNFNDDLSLIYNSALSIARNGDLVSWRKLSKQATLPTSEKFNALRKKHESRPQTSIEKLQEVTLEVASIYCPAFVIALAGVESGREKFSHQIALMDEVLNPRHWNMSGLTSIVELPSAVAYIYQALHGSICLHTGQLDLASKFVRGKITRRNDNKAFPLIQCHEIIGWPDSLGRKSTEAWSFLINLPEHWGWLNNFFGTKDEYKEALCAYYMALNIIEFCDTISEGREEVFEQKEIRLDVPLCFLQEDGDSKRRAYRLLLNHPQQIKDIWQKKNVEDGKVQQLWPRWIHHLKYWLSQVYDFGFSYDVTHENLFEIIE